MNKILVQRDGGIGDVLMATAICRVLKLEYPSALIIFRTAYPEVLIGNPDISVIIGKDDLDPLNIDLFIDMNDCGESKLVRENGQATEEEYMTIPRLDLLFKHTGTKQPNKPQIVYNVTEEENQEAQKKLASHQRTIVYSLNCTSDFRTYPIELATQTLDQLSNEHQIVVIGKRIWDESHSFNVYYKHWIKKNPHILDLVNKTSIRQMAAIIKNADLLIAADTGLVHLSYPLNTPCIGLYGPIDPKLRTSYYENVYPLFMNLPCTSCGERPQMLKKQCPSWGKLGRGGAACMWAIKPRQIIDLVAKIFETSDQQVSSCN